MKNMARSLANPFISFLHKVSIFSLIIISLSLIVLGIWLLFQTPKIGVFQIGFIVIGSMQLLSCIVGLLSKYSINGLKFLVYILGSLIVVEILTIIICFLMKDQINKWIAEGQTINNQVIRIIINLMSKNSSLSIFLCLMAFAIQIVCLIMTLCYIYSLKASRIKQCYTGNGTNLIDALNTDDYIEILNTRHTTEKELIRQKYDDKRRKFSEQYNVSLKVNTIDSEGIQDRIYNYFYQVSYQCEKFVYYRK